MRKRSKGNLRLSSGLIKLNGHWQSTPKIIQSKFNFGFSSSYKAGNISLLPKFGFSSISVFYQPSTLPKFGFSSKYIYEEVI